MKKILFSLVILGAVSSIYVMQQDPLYSLLNELKNKLEETYGILKDIQNSSAGKFLEISEILKQNEDFLTDTLIPSINRFQKQAKLFFNWLKKYTESSNKDEESEPFEFTQLVHSLSIIPLKPMKENIEQLNQLLIQDVSKDDIRLIINFLKQLRDMLMKELIIFINDLKIENADDLKQISWFSHSGDEHFDDAIVAIINAYEEYMVADDGYLSQSITKWQEKLKAI